MIGVDWGTSGFRAYRLTPGGEIRDRRAGARGIMAVADGRFAETLREEIGPWLAAGEERVLLSGMISHHPANLDFANDLAQNKIPTYGYALVYPLLLIGKIVFVQMLWQFL